MIITGKMVTKTIGLSEHVYLSLKERKKKGETFSDLIARLLREEDRRERRPISDFFGTLEDEDAEWDEIEKEIYADRDRTYFRDDSTD